MCLREEEEARTGVLVEYSRHVFSEPRWRLLFGQDEYKTTAAKELDGGPHCTVLRAECLYSGFTAVVV